MEQKRKYRRLHATVLHFCFSCFILSCANNGTKSETANVLMANQEEQAQESGIEIEEINENEIPEKTICLKNLPDEFVGTESGWVSNLDFNPELNKVDTFWTETEDSIYTSNVLDQLLHVKNGNYINSLSDYRLGDAFFDLVSKINVSTDSAYCFILQTSNDDCKPITDIIGYDRLYNVSWAFEEPQNGKYINYLAVGAFINNDGSIYDDRTKEYIFEGEEHNYQIKVVYGIDKDGKATRLVNKYGVAITPYLNRYYYGDTIVFSIPF